MAPAAMSIAVARRVALPPPRLIRPPLPTESVRAMANKAVSSGVRLTVTLPSTVALPSTSSAPSPPISAEPEVPTISSPVLSPSLPAASPTVTTPPSPMVRLPVPLSPRASVLAGASASAMRRSPPATVTVPAPPASAPIVASSATNLAADATRRPVDGQCAAARIADRQVASIRPHPAIDDGCSLAGRRARREWPRRPRGSRRGRAASAFRGRPRRR